MDSVPLSRTTIRFNGSGTRVGYNNYGYDGNHLLVSDSSYDTADVLNSHTSYEYSNGMKIRNDVYGKTTRSYQTFEYDASGKRTKSMMHDTLDAITRYTIYSYSNGLMDTCKFFNNKDVLTGSRVFTIEKKDGGFDYMMYGNW